MTRVLIVDDDEVARVVLGRVLEESGYAVQYASSAESALEAHQAQAFDVILTDLAMPGAGGLGLIRRLRSIQDGTPIVAISGEASENLSLASDYGANAVLPKPVSRRELVDSIDRTVMADPDAWEEVS